MNWRARLVLGIVVLSLAVIALFVWRAGSPSSITTASIALPQLTDLSGLDVAAAALISQKHQEAMAAIDDANARAELAMAYHANGMLEAAESAYRQTLSLEPDLAHVWFLFGRVQRDLARPAAALNSINRAIELDPSYIAAHSRKGYWLFEAGDLTAAQRAFDEALMIRQDDLNSRIGLARILLSNGQHDDAIADLEKLRRDHTNTRYIGYLLGLAYRQAGRRDESRALLEAGAGSTISWRGADSWSDDMQRFERGYRVEYESARRLVVRGQTSRAIQLLQRMRESHPDDAPVLMLLATALTNSDRLADARQVLEQGLEAHPDHFGLLLNLGAILLQLNDPTGALQHTQRAIAQNPTLAHAHVQHGRILIVLNRLEPAEQALAQALQYDVQNTEAFRLLALTLQRLGKTAPCVELLERMVATLPAEPQGYVMLGGMYRNLGRTAEARSVVEQAIERFPAHQQLRQLQQLLGPPGDRTPDPV